jgi:microsomal dipeptidase-like Zn-dependent dipeptidase
MRRSLPLVVLALVLAIPASALAQVDWCPPGTRWWPVLGCLGSGLSDEPSTNVADLPPQTQPAGQPVRGIADVHNHQFANLGFGGVVFWGASFDPARGINGALAWCDYTWQFPIINLVGARTDGAGPGFEAHGPSIGQGITHPVSLGVREGLHAVGGTGAFDGWPTFRTMTHQQMYHRWLKRAYEGGLRLSVMLAVNNEAMCRASKKRQDWGGTVCDDMPAVDRQLQAAKDLEAFVDLEDNGARDASGWYQIAYTPSQARQIIRDGKLAVVLGIEVDSLFGCKWGATGCDEAHVRGEAARYYALGVRHIYPIHQFDNPFGGAAMFKDLLNTGNAVVTGHHFNIRNCVDQGYSYNVGSDFFVELFAAFMGTPFPNMAYYDAQPADCNVLGLSSLGAAAIDAFMDQRMIIDVDHMSRLMIDSVLAIAENREPNPYPLVSGHTDFYDLAQPGYRSEFTLTAAQLRRIRDLGGMITATTLPHNDKVCYSSADYAGYYLHALSTMDGGPYGEGYEAVAFSTDFGGWGLQPGPRFGRRWVFDEWCEDDSAPRLFYPFPGPFGGWFYPQTTGQRTFDFNVEGLAHVGLVPDLIADLKASGRLTDAQLDPLYNSAETYIRMWEAIVPSPTITPHLEGTRGAGEWFTSDVTVTWTVAPNGGNEVLSTSGCGSRTIAADTAGTTVICTATTAAGPASASVAVKRDATPPSWEVVSSSVPPGTWTRDEIRVTFRATDATSGVAQTEATVVLDAEGADQTASHRFTDRAGNVAVASASGFGIDRTPPAITATIAPPPNGAGWHNTDVTVTFTAADALSGVRGDATAVEVVSAEGRDREVTHGFVDVAGNAGQLTVGGIEIDKTPPEIAVVSRVPEANGVGWNNEPVTVTWSCVDALSGVAIAPLPQILVVEGAEQAATGTCVDIAGNVASSTEAPINIDLTLPQVACAATPAVLWPPNQKLVPVTVALTRLDALSGVASYALLAATSSEPDAGLSADDPPGDIAGFLAGGTALTGSLRAQRAGEGPGRTYALRYEIVDAADNAATCTATVLVPHDQKK